MKTEKNIFLAFVLNLAFSVFEVVGGVLTGSVAILSDAIHDTGDAMSIGIAFFLERKSKKQPDERYTYGYARYSIVGGLITTLILLLGSVAVICHAVIRMVHPTEIHYNGMIVFAVIGVGVNLVAALVTRKGDSLNQRAVNLHMLEDVLGWLVVLIGAVVMKVTGISRLDPLMSLGVALFILVNALRNLGEQFSVFLEKTPSDVDVRALTAHLTEIEGVLGIHHVHVWSMDGHRHYATLHVVTNGDPRKIKEQIREELREHGIAHATLELEGESEPCQEVCCHIAAAAVPHHHHHHHHHHE